MRLPAVIILSLLLLALAGSCDGNHAVDETLDRAEAIMHSAPDSALAMLDSINPEALRGQRRRALHALLLSQAMDKNRIDSDNDSLINIAVSFYADDDDRRHRMLAYYYLGRVKYNAKDYTSTMLAYYKALDIAKELNDHYWVGLSAREISHTYSEAANCEEEAYYAQIAFEHMRLTGKHSHICSALNRLVTALFDKGNHEESQMLAFNLLDSAKIHNIPKFEYVALRMIGKTYLAMERYHEATPYLQKACEFKQATNNDSSYLGFSYIMDGRKDDALMILKQTGSHGGIANARLRYEVALRNNDYVSAIEALNQFNAIVDEKFRVLIESDFSKLIIEHVNTEKKIALNNYDKAQANKRLLIITLAVLTALIATIAIYYNRKQRKTIRNNNAIAEELRQILSLKDEQNEQAKEAINDLMSSRYETIDRLCGLCYEQKDNTALKARISDEVVSTINSMTSPDGKLPELERNADRFHGGLMSRFRS